MSTLKPFSSMSTTPHDTHVSALGIKGVGEIGVTGTAGAVANAVWHATGLRVRQFPITLDRIFARNSKYSATA